MKLKFVCAWIVVGLVLASTATTWAVTVPAVPNGVTFLASRNVDNGTAYIPTDPGLIGQTIDPDNPPAGVTVVGPRGGLPGEDSWGLALMYQIADGYLKADGTVGAKLPIYYDNSAGMNDTWLVGTFWGGHDTAVTFEAPTAPSVSTFTVLTENLQFELWAVDKAALDAAAQSIPEFLPFDATDRTAANRYNGWMEDAMLAGSAVKLLRGESTFVRFNGDAYPTATAGVYRFAGDTVAYFDIDETDASYLWNPTWGANGLFEDPDGNFADMYFTWDLEAGLTWDTLSRDFGGVNVVPEPVTMFGIFLGISSLVGYSRKRFA